MKDCFLGQEWAGGLVERSLDALGVRGGGVQELVALLRGQGCHDEALQLLRQLSQSPLDLPVPPAGQSPSIRLCTKILQPRAPTVDL